MLKKKKKEKIVSIAVKVIEKSIFIHNIEVLYITDYTVINKQKDYKS